MAIYTNPYHLTDVTPVTRPVVTISRPNYADYTVGSILGSDSNLYSLNTPVLTEGDSNLQNYINYTPTTSFNYTPTNRTVGGALTGASNAFDKLKETGSKWWGSTKQVGGQINTGFNALSTFDKVNTGLQAVGSILDGLNTRKQLKLVKQQLNHNINNDNRNYEMARRSYNSQLEDRQRYREAYWRANHANNPNNGIVEKPLTVNEYLTKYGA